MPPPPPGMQVLAASSQPQPGHAPEAVAGDAQAPPGGADDGNAGDAGVNGGRPAEPATPPTELPDAMESLDEELEAMRALEAATIDPKAQAEATLRLGLSQLGYGTLLRDRLEEALLRAELAGEDLPFVLAPVTDVSTFDVAVVRDRYDIPLEMHPLVAQYVRFFQGGGRKWFRRWMARSTRFIPLMQPILEEKGLPRDLVYLSMIESGFNTSAKSWARAVGPWQFIAGTAKMFNLKEDFWVDERRDPVKATRAAGDYLGLLYQTLGHWYLAWAGYNTGGGRVRWMIQRFGTNDFWALADQKKGFAKETKHYVPKLIACALVAKHPEAFGFTRDEFDFEPAFAFDEVPLQDPVDLEVLATAAGTTAAVLRELNPELKRWTTPPASSERPYRLRIPKGSQGVFTTAFAKLAPAERLHFQIHRVAKGDTLSKIAQRYHSAPEAIMRLNGLKSVRALKLNVDLAVPVPSASALKAGRADAALERQVVRARRAGLAAVRPEEEIPAGAQPAPSAKTTLAGGTVRTDTLDGKLRVLYGVAKGDSLWSIARRFDVRVADLREWNESLATSRGLKVGSSLTVWPGANADLSGSGRQGGAQQPAGTAGGP